MQLQGVICELDNSSTYGSLTYYYTVTKKMIKLPFHVLHTIVSYNKKTICFEGSLNTLIKRGEFVLISSQTDITGLEAVNVEVLIDLKSRVENITHIKFNVKESPLSINLSPTLYSNGNNMKSSFKFSGITENLKKLPDKTLLTQGNEHVFNCFTSTNTNTIHESRPGHQTSADESIARVQEGVIGQLDQTCTNGFIMYFSYDKNIVVTNQFHVKQINVKQGGRTKPRFKGLTDFVLYNGMRVFLSILSNIREMKDVNVDILIQPKAKRNRLTFHITDSSFPIEDTEVLNLVGEKEEKKCENNTEVNKIARIYKDPRTTYGIISHMTRFTDLSEPLTVPRSVTFFHNDHTAGLRIKISKIDLNESYLSDYELRDVFYELGDVIEVADVSFMYLYNGDCLLYQQTIVYVDATFPALKTVSEVVSKKQESRPIESTVTNDRWQRSKILLEAPKRLHSGITFQCLNKEGMFTDFSDCAPQPTSCCQPLNDVDRKRHGSFVKPQSSDACNLPLFPPTNDNSFYRDQLPSKKTADKKPKIPRLRDRRRRYNNAASASMPSSANVENSASVEISASDIGYSRKSRRRRRRRPRNVSPDGVTCSDSATRGQRVCKNERDSGESLDHRSVFSLLGQMTIRGGQHGVTRYLSSIDIQTHENRKRKIPDSSIQCTLEPSTRFATYPSTCHRGQPVLSALHELDSSTSDVAVTSTRHALDPLNRNMLGASTSHLFNMSTSHVPEPPTLRALYQSTHSKPYPSICYASESSPRHAPELSTWHAPEASTLHTQDPSTRHALEPSIQYAPELSTWHAPELSTWHAPELSTWHAPEASTRHTQDPSTRHALEPSIQYAPELSTWHAPELSTWHTPELSTWHAPEMSTWHAPELSTRHKQDQSTRHALEPSIQYAPELSTWHALKSSTQHALDLSTTRHAPELSTQHAPEPSIRLVQEPSTRHVLDLSTRHAPELSTCHTQEPSTWHALEPSSRHTQDLSTRHALEPSIQYAPEPSTWHAPKSSIQHPLDLSTRHAPEQPLRYTPEPSIRLVQEPSTRHILDLSTQHASELSIQIVPQPSTRHAPELSTQRGPDMSTSCARCCRESQVTSSLTASCALVPASRRDIQHASYPVYLSSSDVRHAPYPVDLSSCDVRHSLYPVDLSSRDVRHASYPVDLCRQVARTLLHSRTSAGSKMWPVQSNAGIRPNGIRMKRHTNGETLPAIPNVVSHYESWHSLIKRQRFK